MSRAEQEALGGLDPATRVREARAGADGVDNAHRRGLDAFHAFEEMIEHSADVVPAALV
ncbi:MAG TPA: hypothetical protein VGR72_10815 [Candidatus Acidoferrales bacterium]|nr:hypothetical protein [Candidatus Acidoferrales bacterium]